MIVDWNLLTVNLTSMNSLHCVEQINRRPCSRHYYTFNRFYTGTHLYNVYFMFYMFRLRLLDKLILANTFHFSIRFFTQTYRNK